MWYFRKTGRFVPEPALFFLLVVLLCASACSRVDDKQPDFAKTPPEAIIQQVKNRVPDATQISFSPVVAGKVWLARTYGTSKMHVLAVSRKVVLLHLSTYTDAPPEDIRKAIPDLYLPAGIFAETKEAQNPGNTGYREFQSVYVVKSERFLLTCRTDPADNRYINVNLHPRAYSQFVSTDFDDLPPGIQKLPASWNGFQRVTITEEGNGAVFQLQFKDGILEVSDMLEVLYSDLGNNTTDVARDELPGQITEWIAGNPPPAGLSGFSCRRFRFADQEGYRLIFQNDTQKMHLFFDISGKLRYQYFTASAPV